MILSWPHSVSDVDAVSVLRREARAYASSRLSAVEGENKRLKANMDRRWKLSTSASWLR